MRGDVLFNNSSLPLELDRLVRSEVREGERLLWVGQPCPGQFSRATIPIVLFGIPWTAFAIFWMAAASGMLFGEKPGGGGASAFFFLIFPLFGLPFVLVGLGMLTSPYWLWRQAKRTCYALTDRRAILWQAGLFNSLEVRSYGPDDLGAMHRTQRIDGSGDLVFDEFVSLGKNRNGYRTLHSARRGFLGIDDVRKVEELLRSALLPANRDKARD